MDGVAMLFLGTLVLGPYFAIRLGGWGVLLGTLTVWLVPVGVRTWLCWMGDVQYGGFGLGVHFVFGWFMGFVWCGGIRIAALRLFPGCVVGRPDE